MNIQHKTIKHNKQQRQTVRTNSRQIRQNKQTLDSHRELTYKSQSDRANKQHRQRDKTKANRMTKQQTEQQIYRQTKT